MPPASAEPIVIQRGCILAYRVLDVCDELALDIAEKLLADTPGLRRVRFTRDGEQAMQFAAPPIDIELGKRTIDLVARAGAEVDVSARFFDFGAVSVELELTIPPGTRMEDLLPLCDELYESSRLEELARREVDLLMPRLRDATIGRHEFLGVETYTVVYVQSLEGASPRELADSPVLAKLIVGEAGPKALSHETRRDVLRHAHSYLDDDLVIIDWNSAFVLEPSGSRDVPEILEFATSQLLELRYYDTMLDVELGHIYDDYAIARRDWRSLLRSPYERLARNVLRRFVELTDFTERVDNSLKVVGDFYLARIYQSALRRFRISDWRSSIDSKQALVARSYDLLKGEVDIRRSTVLEVIVIALIAIELFAAFRGH